VRQEAASVSDNLRRKEPFIARRALHHCASLQLWVEIEAVRPVSLKTWFPAIDARAHTIAADPSFALVRTIGAHAIDKAAA
jgi:hypothetical protein